MFDLEHEYTEIIQWDFRFKSMEQLDERHAVYEGLLRIDAHWQKVKLITKPVDGFQTLIALDVLPDD